MRAKNRKTDEIVDIKSYNENNSKYYIHGVNSRGVEFDGEGDNFNKDFEFIEEKLEHWQDVAERAAIAALQGLLANPYSFYSSGTMKEGIALTALLEGETLAAKLKEEQEEEQKEQNKVKEVDFAKEFDAFTKEELRVSNEYEFFYDIEKTANFFFQLGLKAQK